MKHTLEELNAKIENEPHNPELYVLRAECLYDAKKYEEAVADCDAAINLNPADADAYVMRGKVCWKMKRYDEALSDCDKAIELKPDFAEAYYNRSKIYHDLKRFDEARADYYKAVELNPFLDRAETFFNYQYRPSWDVDLFLENDDASTRNEGEIYRKKTEHLEAVLEKHQAWLNDEPEGEKADLRMAELSEANLRKADLRIADLRRANLSGANLSEANLRKADLRIADLSGANLSGAKLSEADLSEADLSQARLIMAGLSKANLIGANLVGADLRGASLSTACLVGANLNGADFRGAYLLEEQLSQAILNGTSRLSVNPREADLFTSDPFGPSQIDLSESDLFTALPFQGLLLQAERREAYLRDAKLRRAILDGASGKVLAIGPIGPKRGTTYAYLADRSIYIKNDSYQGPLERLEAGDRMTRPQTSHDRVLAAALDFIKTVAREYKWVENEQV
jgi:uncharacterized protein YjbI with pentapeptide repeats